MKNKIKTFQAACKALSLDPKKVIPNVSTFPKQHQTALIAHAKLVIIAQALNEGWEPDWTNHDEAKYYPWFYHSDKPGSAFSFGGCGYYDSHACVGSRLCFKTRELAEYAGKQFLTLYKEYYTL